MKNRDGSEVRRRRTEVVMSSLMLAPASSRLANAPLTHLSRCHFPLPPPPPHDTTISVDLHTSHYSALLHNTSSSYRISRRPFRNFVAHHDKATMSESRPTTAAYAQAPVSDKSAPKIIHLDDMDFGNEPSPVSGYQYNCETCSCDEDPHTRGIIKFPYNSPNRGVKDAHFDVTELGPPASCEKCGAEYQVCYNFLEDGDWCYRCVGESRSKALVKICGMS